MPLFPRLHALLSSQATIVPPTVVTGVGPTGHVTTHYQPPDTGCRRSKQVNTIPDELVDPVLRDLDINVPSANTRDHGDTPSNDEVDPIDHDRHPSPPPPPTPPTNTPAAPHATTRPANQASKQKENTTPPLPAHLTQSTFDALKANFKQTPARNAGITDFLKHAIEYVLPLCFPYLSSNFILLSARM